MSKAVELETETQRKVSDSLSKIEVALADWESCRKRPKELGDRIKRLRMSHELLSAWEKESLKGKKDMASTVKRLRGFTEVCARLKRLEGA